MKRFSTIFQVITVFALAIGSVALAQSTATLTGTVSDPTGAMVPGAAVKVHSLDTNADREVATDDSGNFVVPSLQPGNYMVQVTAAGFGTFVMQKVELAVDQRATLNVKLNLASTGETVEVTGTAPVIDASTITVGQVIDRRTVQEIPLNGRHFLDLTTLTPGGVTAPANGNLTSPSRGLGANSFITAGNREDSVNFQINGVNLNDMVQNQITFQPSINTTSEFKINNSTYSAEYGRSSGSIVNVSTRSGTNAFHGEAFDYFRNNGLDARNYFNRRGTAQATLKRNNFGGAFGGPIWRDKTFFFVSYEGLIQHQDLTLNSGVLTAAQRAQVVARGNPASVALLPLIPIANDPTGSRYIASAPGPVTVHQGTADGLQQFGTKDTLHGFYAFQSDNRTEPNLQNNTIPGFGDHRNAHRQVLTLNETHLFSPRLVNEARIGFNRISIAFNPAFVANPNDYHLSTGVNSAIGIPQMTITDISLNFGGPATFPQGRTDTLGIISNTTTYVTGKHALKFGGEFRRFLNANFANDTGTVGFNTTTNFINGVANVFTITPSIVSSRVYVNAIGAFIQDNYKVLPNVTLEMGLRFEWNGTPTEGANRFVVFDPTTVSLVQTGTNGLGNVYNQNYNWQPRVGFAYDVFSTGKTVVRGGYGYMTDQPATNAVTGLASNTPFAAPVTYNSSTAPIPLTNLYNSAAAAGLTVNTIDRNFKNAYTQSFNLNLQQEIPWGVAIQVGYFGSVGRHLRARRNLNQPLSNGVRPYLTLSNTSPIAHGASVNSNFADVTSVGSSNYNAMWLTGRKNLGHGLQFNATYNWSKSMDLNSLGSQGVYTFQDSYNPASNYGLSDFDTRNRIAANAIYELPFKGNRFVEGFQLSGIVQWQSGNPMNIINSGVAATVNGLTGTTGTVRPNLVGPIVTSKTRLTNGNVGWISSTLCPGVVQVGACSFVNVNGFGNLRRNAGTGPGFANVDMSLQKSTKLTERLTLQLRADAFDLFNHPSFTQPTLSDTSASFGQISLTRFPVSDLGSSRQLQLAGKFIF
jgi:hypothetical protein